MYASCFELTISDSIKSYNCTTGDFVEIVNFPKGSKLTYKNPDFVACVHESELIVYWVDFNVSVRYPLPTSKAHSEKKKYTCIAAHPNDCILATGMLLAKFLSGGIYALR
uniref:Uncharacterized protein n=1 Tax=Trichobilharzia regenti TaxID=157069 RepID=A0AA85JA33_TRIRE|nr:unnamed protein product [Trichobilharzia regenti]